jgi:DNA-binding transcriptional LysR family regulator
MKEHNVRPSRKMELTTNEAVKQAVMAGLGFSVMPLIGIGHELRQGRLHIIPVQGLPLSSEWNIIWLKGKSMTPVMAGYIDFLNRHRERLMHTHFNWYENFS